jgi:hypothetical protein
MQCSVIKFQTVKSKVLTDAFTVTVPMMGLLRRHMVDKMLNSS